MKTIRLSGRDVYTQIKRWLIRLTAPPSCRQVWKTLDGRRIRICDMESSHLLNTIHWLRGRASTPKREKLKKGLVKEAWRRGLGTGEKPKWLVERNRAFGENQRRQIQEKIDHQFDRMFGPQGNW